MSRMQVLALSGSLRAASINTALLRAATRLAPPPMQISLYERVGELPLFNIDLEAAVPPSVAHLREAVSQADALLIASPEYAHGVSGVMKNTLDWLVSLETFVGKPVALLNAQPRAHYSDAALRETLKTMSATLIEPASVSVALNADSLTEAGMLASPGVSAQVRGALAELLAAVSPHGAAQGPSFPLR